MATAALASTCGSGAAGATIAAALQFFAASQCLVRDPLPQPDIHNGSRFDFIIVGGGTAGSTLAARLSEMANFNVLLVEAGGEPPQESIIPGFRNSLLASPYDWNFTTINDEFSSQALSGGSQRQPRGKMLGGSGSINDMVYARGFPADYNEWATIAGDTWSWTNVLEYFKKTEEMTDEMIINDSELMQFHGRNGEIEVSGFNNASEDTARFLQAFEELGFDIVNDMTYPHKIGAGRFSHTIRDGKRDSSFAALLDRVRRDNLFILKDALVTKILIENNTAVGIDVQLNDRQLQLYADVEVIVSAGTFNTAKLLHLSGIGPKEYLEELGIDVVQDLPVGDNLHDHVMVLSYLAAESGTCTTDQAASYMEMIKYLYDRTGSFSRSDSMGALLSLDDSEPNLPDFAFYPVCIPKAGSFYEGCMSVIGFNREICSQLDSENQNYELLSIAIVLLKPISRGKVRLYSADPLEDPVIYSGTFDNLVDLEGYPKAVEVVWSLANTSYFKEKAARVVDIKIDDCEGLEGSDKVKCMSKSMATSAWHAVGTAAMGSVVDSRLKVIGMDGLRVVDASVIPKVTRGNTNAPVVMIAEKAADFIKEYYGKG